MREAIVITGNAQRIGLYLTEKFIENFKIISIVRRKSLELIDLEKKFPERIFFYEMDFTSQTIDKNFWDWFSSKKLKLKAFIHCASTFIYDDVYSSSKESMDLQSKVNYEVFVHAIISYMQYHEIKNKKPHFIALIDAKVEKLNSAHFSYTLSKLALHSSIKFLAMSCAEKILVNAVSPGLTLPSGEQSIEDFEYAQSQMPLGKLNMKDIYQMIDFLMNNQMISGQNFLVDAGYHIIDSQDVVFMKND